MRRNPLFARQMALSESPKYRSDAAIVCDNLESYGWAGAATTGIWAGKPAKKGKAWREVLTVHPSKSVPGGKPRFHAEPVPEDPQAAILSQEREARNFANAPTIQGPARKRGRSARKRPASKDTPANRRARRVIEVK